MGHRDGIGSGSVTTLLQHSYDVADSGLSGAHPLGRRTTMDESGHTAWAYDLMGRMTRERKTVTVKGGAAVSYSVAYAYNYDGTVASITYPSGWEVNYGYNRLGYFRRSP